MSDKQPNPAPDGKPAGDDPLAALVGNSIDDLLAEAESLASTVAHEVGIAPPTADPDTPATPPDEQTAPPVRTPELDASNAPEAALAAMETLVANGAPETPVLDAPLLPETEAPDGLRLGPLGLQPATNDGTYLSDVPESATEADARSAAVESPEEAPPDKARGASEPPEADLPTDAALLATPDDQAVVDEEIAAAEAESLTKPEAPPTTDTGPKPTQANADGRLRGLLHRITRGLKALPRLVLSSPYWLLVGVLWLIDLPFAWMSPALKNKLGYVGLVTAMMAAIAWVLVTTGSRG